MDASLKLRSFFCVNRLYVFFDISFEKNHLKGLLTTHICIDKFLQQMAAMRKYKFICFKLEIRSIAFANLNLNISGDSLTLQDETSWMMRIAGWKNPQDEMKCETRRSIRVIRRPAGTTTKTFQVDIEGKSMCVVQHEV